MKKITLKTANRPTSVSRAKVRKAVQEAYSTTTENIMLQEQIPQVNVVVTNRMPSKSKKA